ncbi:CU044_5270 family protein [Streptomyces sp. NPDC058470]|uniref:CU044_5270 family protein n=1 Tax=Streptomyces sp. NPDC058470 TaxID=3346515 RepID=UPI00365078BB
MNQLPEQDLPPGRHQLLKEHLMTEIRREDPTPARSGSKWLRPAIVAGAVATAAAVTFVLLPAGGTAAPGAAPAASQSAVELLGDIALAAEHQRVPDGIRDGQFLYVESKVGYSTQGGGKSATVDPVHQREIWLSVDGTRWGLLEEDRLVNQHVKLEPSTPGNPTNTNYRNLQTLPTDPDTMLDWLYENSEGHKNEDQSAFAIVGDLVRESLLPPDVAAALFRAAAKIPGVVVVPDAVDAAGRHGVAVARVDNGQRQGLIFDEKTFEYLGERTVAVEDLDNGLKKGQTIGTSAILKREIVDKPGQRP